MHQSMLSPRVGGGEGYPREIGSGSFSLGGDFDIWVLPWGRELDMATILEDRKNLEPLTDISIVLIFPPNYERKKGKRICFIFL